MKPKNTIYYKVKEEYVNGKLCLTYHFRVWYVIFKAIF